MGNIVLFYVLVGAVMFFIGLAKGGLGGIMGGLATPLLALMLPVDEVIGLVLPILMFADVFALAMHWRKWELRLVGLLLPGAVIGVTLGTYFIINVPTRVLRVALGIIVLLFVAYKALENRILESLDYQPHDWHGMVAGTVTGFSSALAHTGAPPVSIYLLFQKLKPAAFVSTAVLFFFILNWIKVPYYFFADLFNFQRLWQIAFLLPLVPAGVWFGKWVIDKIDRQTFEKVIIVVLAILGLLLILT